MRSTFTKVTAFILSGALILSGNDVISFAKSGQNLSSTVAAMNENTEESADEPSGTGDGSKEGEEKAGTGETGGTTPRESGTDGTDMEESTSSEAEVTTPEESETVMTTTEEPTTGETTPEESETEEASTSNPGEEADARIIDVELLDVDENSAVYQDSNNKYYTKENELTAIVLVEKRPNEKIDLEVITVNDSDNNVGDNENDDKNDNENNDEGDTGNSGVNDNENSTGNNDANDNGSDNKNDNGNNNVGGNESDTGNNDDNNVDSEREHKLNIKVSKGVNKVTINVKIDNKIVDSTTLTIICDQDGPTMEIKHFIGERTLLEESEENGSIRFIYTNKEDFRAKLEVDDSISGVSAVQVKIGEKLENLSKKEETEKTYIYDFSGIVSDQELKYVVTDNAGNYVESPTYKVVFDDIKPEWMAESEKIKLNNNKTISVEARDEDGGSGIQRVYAYIKEKKVELEKADNNEYTFDLDNDLISLLKEVKKDFLECEFFVEDKAGNINPKKFTLFYDFTGPKINVKVFLGKDVDNGSSIDKDSNSEKYYVAGDCTIKIVAEDIANGGLASGVNSIELKDVTDEKNPKSITPDGKEITKEVDFGENIKNDSKKYIVTAKDGKENESIYNFEIIFDAEDPVIKIIGPEDVLKKTYFNQEDIDKMSFVVEEKNFSKADIKIESINKEKEPTIGKWKTDNSAKLNFSEDGVYGFKITCTDKAGNEGEVIVKNLVLDTKAPEIDIAYEHETEDKDRYYNRSAKIMVTDENFNEEYGIISEDSAYSISKWMKEESDNTYSCIVSYKEDGEYNFQFSCTDMAGNTTVVDSKKIIIDQTVPVVNVNFESDEKAENEIYYNKPRKASVIIKEQNFNSDSVEIEWSESTTSSQRPKLGEWSSNGIEHTASILLEQDGEYGFCIKCTDDAGNVGKSEEVKSFVIDRNAPVITLTYGSESPENEIYYKERTITVKVEDDNLDEDYGIKFELTPGTVEPKIVGKEVQNGNVYVYKVSLEDDGKYMFNISARDKAGNMTVKECIAKEIVIDKTNPVIELKLDQKDATNGNYYKARVATVIITEQNFDKDGVEIIWADSVTTGSRPSLSGWSGENDVHTATIQFTEDGVYNFQIKCTDLARNERESNMAGQFVIDTTNPEVKIEYDKESPINGKYHNTFRTARVIVTDDNFDDTCVTKFDITSDGDKPRIGKWTKTKSDGSGSNQYTCEVFFASDGEYSFKFSCEDLAGNKSDTEDGGSFIIDTTRPEISVAYDNNNARNEKYYNNTRTATITIADKSFSDDLVKIEPLNASGVDRLPAISSWTADGEKHTVRINFTEDGSYGFRITCSDLADNSAKEYLSEVFIIDRASPEITFGGVKNNSANNGAAAPTLKCTDSYLDETSTQIILTGTNHGELTGTAQKSAVKDGFQLVYPDFEHTQEMDDFYTLKVRAVDLAGNETEDELNFSVNRFGSTYRISVDTQRLVNEYYTGKAPTITVTEINIDELEYGEVTISKDGQTVTLTQGSNYAVTKEGDDEDWKSYTYSIKPGNFAKDGVYSVGFYSKDKASNTSDNRIKGKEIEFALDTTAPSIVADGIESDRNYNEKSRDVTVDVKDNMYLTNLSVTDNGETILDMSEKELADNGGLVTFVLDEDDTQRDIVITAMDKVNNMQKLEYHDVLITSKTEVIKEVETSKPVTDSGEDILKPAISAGFGIPSYDEDNSLLYMVTEVMSAAVLITAVVVFYRKRRKRM